MNYEANFAARIAKHAANELQQHGWATSTNGGERKAQYWTVPRQARGVTRVWINAASYPESIKATYYFADAAVRDRFANVLERSAEGSVLDVADVRIGKSRHQDELCRYFAAAVVSVEAASAELAASALDAPAIGTALAAASRLDLARE